MLDDNEDGLQVIHDSQLTLQSRAEIDVQISTAKRYPRSLKSFKSQAMEMATLDEDTAGSMFYALPRGGKKIEGPSVRMAEVIGSCFGNLRYGARIVDCDDKFVTAQGACHDLEKNVAITYEVKRRITNAQGKRYNDDMIQTTGLAAASIALREAIFRVVPRSLFKDIYEEAKLASIGKAATMSEKRHKAMDWFKKAGATEKQLLEFLGRASVDEVSVDDIITLRGLVTAIRDGETTVDDALRGNEQPKRKVGASELNDTLEAAENSLNEQPLDTDLQISQLIDENIAAINNATDPEVIERTGKAAIIALKELGDDGSSILKAVAERHEVVNPKSKTKQGSLV